MRLLLIEDDPALARELTLRWQRGHREVVAASTLAAAREAAARGRFDLVVLDLGLPDGDGVDWLVRLRERDAATPVLVLTARDRVADRVRGLQAGADDYLAKPFAVEELDARVAALLRRGLGAGGPRLHFAGLDWFGDEGRVEADGVALDLSPREFEVLGALLRRAPRLVPKRVLVDALCERNEDLGDAAVEVYVSRLRRKLAGHAVVVTTVRGFGYRLETRDGAGAGR